MIRITVTRLINLDTHSLHYQVQFQKHTTAAAGVLKILISCHYYFTILHVFSDLTKFLISRLHHGGVMKRSFLLASIFDLSQLKLI